jgi:hypothetical protein
MDSRRHPSAISTGVSSPGSSKESITWDAYHKEVQTTKNLHEATNKDLLQETLLSLRQLAIELDKDRWKYE